ncbi:MAG TPA: PQQ-dependent sugar dehydrogenase [Gemmatimonadaceae bacterium]|nr:PQQ-dependent sugar dehydrogenase [Gemmatimonadaceae bacterium]
MRYAIPLVALLAATAAPAAHAQQKGCAPDNAGLVLPAGFCATLFAADIPGARHMAVAANGDVFVAARGGRRGRAGAITALRDTNHDGVADVRRSFGEFSSSEVRLFDGYLYAEYGGGVLRYRLPTGSLEPAGAPDTIVKDLPTGGNHPLKTFVIDAKGVMYVNVGTATNACTHPDRRRVPGDDPCTERDTRGGIWKFDARKTNQTQPMGEHYAVGVRNSIGMDINPVDNTLWVTQHGRDQLSLWPEYTDAMSAESPAEELIHVQEGGDYGWPYCYYDIPKHEMLLAPEYGGHDDRQGRCANVLEGAAIFPAHWAPNGLLFYRGGNFPARYHDGAFIAFHGSWNRAPEPQAGYRVVFQPLKDNKAAGAYENFATGFFTDGKFTALGGRPTGLAEGPDGALYIADDQHGRVWRVAYVGGGR